MARLLRLSAWPLALTVPLAVGVLMIVVSAVFTNEVLRRLAQSQERHLGVAATVYLDWLSSAILPAVLRDDTWEVFDILDRFAGNASGFGKVTTLVTNTEGVVIAASDPRNIRVQSKAPASLASHFEAASDLVVNVAAQRADARRTLRYQGRAIGKLYAEIDIAELLKERQRVLFTLLATNAALALILSALGYLAVRRMIAPLRILTAHLDRSLLGPVRPIPRAQLGRADSEFGRLFRRFNTLAAAVNEREHLASQLAQEERLASLGRLAAGLAHEINNPLGGLFNALDSLKRHGEARPVRERALSLLERGLVHIRDVVRATLVTYRTDAKSRGLRKADLDDLRLLVDPEARRKSLHLDWHVALGEATSLPAGPVCQALLNLLLNACAAAPEGSTIRLEAAQQGSLLRLAVIDEGQGLEAMHMALLEPSAGDAPPEGGGLGLWIVRRLVIELNGHIFVTREAARTSIQIEFPGAADSAPATAAPRETISLAEAPHDA
jgi:signal transduction histidine kinase